MEFPNQPAAHTATASRSRIGSSNIGAARFSANTKRDVHTASTNLATSAVKPSSHAHGSLPLQATMASAQGKVKVSNNPKYPPGRDARIVRAHRIWWAQNRAKS